MAYVSKQKIDATLTRLMWETQDAEHKQALTDMQARLNLTWNQQGLAPVIERRQFSLLLAYFMFPKPLTTLLLKEVPNHRGRV